MAIEGPLRELGIHDVFQLLDLSRKTGTLRVTSDLRGDEGVIDFQAGRVVRASIRSNAATTEELLLTSGRITEEDLRRARELSAGNGNLDGVGAALVSIGAITQKELLRQHRMQVEGVIFELMSWREGFFSFEEQEIAAPSALAEFRVSTESLLMEGARRIDEWSRIAEKVPSLAAVPTFAPVDDDRPTQLDLLPHEWEVLTMIDGVRDLRSIAAQLGRPEFEVAKIAYGLVTTGVVEVRAPRRRSNPVAQAVPEIEAWLHDARRALSTGDPERALEAAIAARNGDPARTDARLVVAKALTRLGRHAEALEELRRALRADPLTPAVHRELGFAALRAGEYDQALARWEHFRSSVGHDDRTVSEATVAVREVQRVLEANANE
jgi:tetratricopeptide (TPR) repeat protein